MMVNSRERWLYISPPKTASSSLTAYFTPRGGMDIDVNDRHRVAIPPEYIDYFKFASVRNPYGRAASMWRYYILHLYRHKYADKDEWWREVPRDKSIYTEFPFRVYMQHILWRSEAWIPFYRQTLTEWLHGIELDAVLHVEQLCDDLARLPFIDEVGNIPQLNVARHQHILRVVYDAEIARLVQEWAGADFDSFGYDRTRYQGEW